MWKNGICGEKETTTERKERLGKWGLGRRPSHAFRARTVTSPKTFMESFCERNRSAWKVWDFVVWWYTGQPNILWFAVLQVPLRGSNGCLGLRKNSKEPRPCLVPDHSNILHFCCFIYFSKILLYSFSLGLYTTTVR